MSLQFKNLYRVLCLAAAAQAASASDNTGSGVRPSDCRARDADSTCAAAVAGAPMPDPTILRPLYDNSIGGVPSTGYAYWGFDFASALAGVASPFGDDMFVNRSPYTATITLTFTIPTSHPCGNDCLPGVQFEVGPSWSRFAPPLVVSGNQVSASYAARPGDGYGWVIGLWQSSNPRLTVTVPQGVTVSMADLGLPADPSVALEIPAVVTTCICPDGTTQACSLGDRYSNGLMGPWYKSNQFYVRGGAFDDCTPIH